MLLRTFLITLALGLVTSGAYARTGETTQKHALTHASVQHRAGKPRAPAKGSKTKKLREPRPKPRAAAAPRRPR